MHTKNSHVLSSTNLYVLLALSFGLSRLAFYLAGVRFDIAPLDTFWQFIDPELLRHDLIQSVLYSPAQPPLFNFIVGLALKIPYGTKAFTILCHAVYSGFALTTVLVLFASLLRLGMNRYVALAVVIVYMLGPAFILYENILFYTSPVLMLIVSIMYLFQRCAEQFTTRRALALFSAMAALIYLRSLFQWPWFAVLFLFCLVVFWRNRRQVVLAAILPIILISALYGKNVVVTGDFATSDWMGMSLSKLTVVRLKPSVRRQLVSDGRLSRLALSDAEDFGEPDRFPELFAGAASTGIPVLDQRYKASGAPNYHSRVYADVSHIAFTDAVAIIKMDPHRYIREVFYSNIMFLRPAAHDDFLRQNRSQIQPWVRAFNFLIAGQSSYTDQPSWALNLSRTGIFIAVGFTAANLYGLFLFCVALWRCSLTPIKAALIFAWLNILYVTAVGNLIEIGENQRFRFLINPLVVMLLVVLAQHSYATIKNMRRRLIFVKPGADTQGIGGNELVARCVIFRRRMNKKTA